MNIALIEFKDNQYDIVRLSNELRVWKIKKEWNQFAEHFANLAISLKKLSPALIKINREIRRENKRKRTQTGHTEK